MQPVRGLSAAKLRPHRPFPFRRPPLTFKNTSMLLNIHEATMERELEVKHNVTTSSSADRLSSTSTISLLDPFVDHSSPFTVYECVKFVLMAPIAVVRMGTIIALINLANCVAWLAMCWGDHYGAFDAVIAGLFRAVCVAASLSVTTTNAIKSVEPIDATTSSTSSSTTSSSSKARVVVFNHVSICDFLVLLRYGVLGFVTHDSYSALPMTRFLVQFAEFVFIRKGTSTAPAIVKRVKQCFNDRHHSISASPSSSTPDESSQESSQESSHEWSGHAPLAIAPEGTLSNGRCLLKFKTGAFVAMVPVQPIVLRYPFRHLNPAWTLDTHVALKVFRILTQFVTPVHVQFLPVVHPRVDAHGRTMETPDQFAQRVRRIMADALAVPMVEQDVRDRLERLRYDM